MKGYLLKIVSNLAVITLAILLAGFCNKNLGSYSEISIIGVFICTITTLITINKKSIKDINKDHFNAALSDIIVILSNTIITIDEYLIDKDHFPTLEKPIAIDKKEHPIVFCHQFLIQFIDRIPETLSQEEKDYTDLIKIIKEHDELLYKETVLASCFGEKDQELIKKLKSIHSQLKKIQKQTTVSQKELYKELTRLAQKLLTTCEFIKETYPKNIKKKCFNRH